METASLNPALESKLWNIRPGTEATVGSRVRAEWMEAMPAGTVSLAGAQPKVVASQQIVEGVVTHIRGDHPTAPTTVVVWILPDDGSPEVAVDSRRIVAVLST